VSLVPVEADYLLTTFSNTENNRQNDLRFSAGFVIRLSVKVWADNYVSSTEAGVQ